MSLKKCVLFIKLIIHLVLVRKFGNILHDLAQKYGDSFTKSDFRKLEKLNIKVNKARLDINYLKNCQNFHVFPKFICFNIPTVNKEDSIYIKRKLLKSALQKRQKEKCKMKEELKVVEDDIRKTVSAIDWYILSSAIKKNVKKDTDDTIRIHERKLSNLTRNNRFCSKIDVISNLSSYNLTQDEQSILQLGLNHCIPPLAIRKTDVFTSFEMIHRFLREDLKDASQKEHLKSELSHLANSFYYNYSPSKDTLRKHKILSRLKKNKNIVITKPDKGSGVVILDRILYDKAINELINDKTKFRKLDSDVTLKRENSLKTFLRTLKTSNLFTKFEYENIYPSGSSPARIYGLPKLHKLTSTSAKPSSIPFRPIVSSIGTYNYNLAKFLCNLLSPHIPDGYCCKDSFTFVKEVNQVSVSNQFLISYDVNSLFTNIPLDETIEIAINKILENRQDLKISKRNLKKLFLFATAQTHFMFNENFYDQIDGVAMGSPLAPVLANLFMGFHETKWIENYKGNKPSFYRRYVDDIFAVFKSEHDANLFFNYLNLQHSNIKFTMEKELNGKLFFLDVFLDNSSYPLKTSIFRKKTFTGLLTNYLSFTSFSYKTGLIRCLVDRAYKINNTWTGFHVDLDGIKKILGQNLYPDFIIDKIICKYINDSKNDKTTNSSECRYFKLPYTGKYCQIISNKLKKIVGKYCKKASIRIIFKSFKLKDNFSAKDPLPFHLKSRVVYKFQCAGCNACYIGETTRHIITRIEEHLKRDKKSHIYKHIHNNASCLNKCDKDCFKILDNASTNWQLKVKEGLHIEWENPEINKQVKYIGKTLTL